MAMTPPLDMNATDEEFMEAHEETGMVDENVPVKLTDWEREPDVATLRAELESSKPNHDLFLAKIKHWNDLLRAKIKPKKVRNRSNVQPKLIRRQAEWRYSALTEPFLSSEKLFSVDPVTFEDQLGAQQNELVINSQFRTKINKVKLIDTYIRSNVDDGSCIIRVGWKRITQDVPVEVPVFTYYAPESPEQMQMVEAAIMAKEMDPRGFEEQADPQVKASVEYFEETGQHAMAFQTGTEMVIEKKIIKNHPTVEVMNPANVFIDPSCGDDIEKAGFVIISFETSKAELAKEPDRYKNLDHVNWESAAIITNTDHETTTPTDFNFRDTLRKKVVAYEYWGWFDINGDETLVPIVATWLGDTLVRLEENPFPDGMPPFVMTNYMPVKRELMGEPDAELLEDNQAVAGAVMRGMIDLLGRSANGQQGFAKGMLDILNRRKFDQGQDYEFNPNMPPQMGVIEHKYPEFPQSAMLMLTLQNQEAEALTGVKSFSGGMSGEAYGEVAAGIRGVLDAASKREMAILRRMAKGIVDVGRKIVSMNQAFLSEQEVVRVTNKKFVTVNREDLAGEFDMEVDISTAEIDNNKAQDLGFMLQTIGNNMDFGIVKIILAEIARLKRMPVLQEAILKFEPTPDPLLEEAKKLEVEKLKMEILKLKSEVDRNNADAEKKLAEANLVDLDTIEQETGTKHERDLEKQRAQAQGNQDMAITKALVTPRKKADGSQTDPDIDAAIGYGQLTRQMNKPRPANPKTGFNDGRGKRGNENPDITAVNQSFLQRNAEAKMDPRLSIYSKQYDPSLDPARNPAARL